MPDEITHDRCSELLAEYARGELDAPERSAVDLHLRDCPDCSSELVAVRALLPAPEEALSEHERARLERDIAWQLGDLIAARPPRARAWTRIAQGLGAAALLALVGVGIVQLGGGRDGNEGGTAAVAPQKGGDADDASGGAKAGAGSDAVTGANAELAPMPRPSFQRHVPALTKAKLAKLGKNSPQFRAFSQAFTTADAATLKDEYVNDLVHDAPTAIQQDQVRECADQVFDTTQSYSLLPAYGAGARLKGKNAIVLGFAWTDRPEGPLDQYMLWVWPVSGCGDVPLDYTAGEIGKK